MVVIRTGDAHICKALGEDAPKPSCGVLMLMSHYGLLVWTKKHRIRCEG